MQKTPFAKDISFVLLNDEVTEALHLPLVLLFV